MDVLVFCIWHAIFVEGGLDPGIARNQSALLTKPVVGPMDRDRRRGYAVVLGEALITFSAHPTRTAR